jgi:hypothetical protein
VRAGVKTLALCLLALAALSLAITLAVFSTSFFLESLWSLVATRSLAALANLLLALALMAATGGAVLLSLLLALGVTGQPGGWSARAREGRVR